MRPCLRIIESEHRSISAVLAGLCHFVDQGLEDKPMPEARVFRAMLQYLDLFAERMHHPKEDLHLFSSLRRRGHEADEVLERLQGDHRRGLGAIRALEQAFLRYEEGGEPFFDAFAREVQDYTMFYREHMRTEERIVFPLAEKHLSAKSQELLGKRWRERRLA